jgi:hypothetical protein
MIGDFNLFAFVDDAHNLESVRRIPLAADLQGEISGLVEEERAAFYATTANPVAFDGGYSVDGDDIFEVKAFPLPAHVTRVLESPHAAPPLSSKELEGFRVRAVFATRSGPTGREVAFQPLDRSAVITKRRSLIFSKDHFTKLHGTGLTLRARLCASWLDGTLRFFSFTNARKVLVLDDLFREATNDDIVSVLQKDTFAASNHKAVIAGVNQWMRRRFTLILKSDVLKKSDPTKLKSTAKRYGVKIVLNGGRVQFPDDHAEARELLRFLSEEYYEGVISGTRFRANSKLIVSTPALT